MRFHLMVMAGLCATLLPVASTRSAEEKRFPQLGVDQLSPSSARSRTRC